MDVKTLVERLGGEEAVRKMAAFQLQNQILVLPLNPPNPRTRSNFNFRGAGLSVCSRICRQGGTRQTQDAHQRGDGQHTRVWIDCICKDSAGPGCAGGGFWRGGRLAYRSGNSFLKNGVDRDCR